jgi:lipopolysaccharide/colanic/teichoic acid biosynthesis glycosyltransferase
MSWPTAKRTIDAALATAALIALAPLLLLTATAVAIALGRPVLFRQNRAGRGGKPFEVLKFRTMLEPDPGGSIVSDADRLTPFGRLLRSTSLDELPSLWNVLRGDMSVVGPRPLPVKYLPRYSRVQARRHEVRPGITGLAQVRGRNALSWEEKFAFDVAYVNGTSLRLDLRIIAATVGVVLRRDGISAAGEATASEFLGSRVVADV